MAKAKSNGYLGLDHDFIRSDRVRSLSTKAGWLLIGIADRYNGRNNGHIPYSVKEAAAWLHCHHRTARRTFDELKEAGLIEAIRIGSFYGKTGTATRWRLTFYPGARCAPSTRRGEV